VVGDKEGFIQKIKIIYDEKQWNSDQLFEIVIKNGTL
jgi:hypothetical protein